MSAETETQRIPSLFHNYLSFCGAAIAIASLSSIVLLILLEVSANTSNAYLGIFAYVLLPAVLVFGLLVIGLGMLWERRRRLRDRGHER